MFTQVERIKKDIEKLSEFNSTPGKGLTRFSFTKEDREAREYIKERMKEASLSVYEDPAGNIVGRRNGANNTPVVMIGSHFDSVKNGGNFDGVAGVVAGLEIARFLNEKNIKTKYSMEFIAMVEEEGGRFGGTLFGSRAMAGKVSKDELEHFRDKNGISVAEAMQKFGFDSANISKAYRDPKTLKAFFELHIEQGPLLEAEQKDVGIVNAIVGINWYEVEVIGRPDHAGTTPMNMRADALVLSSSVIQAVNSLAEESGEGAVATVGEMKVFPGATNIVPGNVLFTVDIRCQNANVIKDIARGINKILEEKCRNQGLSYKMVNKVSIPPVKLSEHLIRILTLKSKKMGLNYRQMVSGAGHDTMIMAKVTDAALVFVPSKNGRSHCPEEWTDYEQIQKGTELVLAAVLDIAEVL
jgi:allantoate deiminase